MDLTIELPTGPISATAIPRYVGDKPNGHVIGVELHVMQRRPQAVELVLSSGARAQSG